MIYEHTSDDTTANHEPAVVAVLTMVALDDLWLDDEEPRAPWQVPAPHQRQVRLPKPVPSLYPGERLRLVHTTPREFRL